MIITKWSYRKYATVIIWLRYHGLQDGCINAFSGQLSSSSSLFWAHPTNIEGDPADAVDVIRLDIIHKYTNEPVNLSISFSSKINRLQLVMPAFDEAVCLYVWKNLRLESDWPVYELLSAKVVSLPVVQEGGVHAILHVECKQAQEKGLPVFLPHQGL